MTTVMDRRYHLHVGLGRLGVGLVLEYVRPDKPIIILQRKNSPDKQWIRDLQSGQTVTLRNGNSLDRRVKIAIVEENSVAIEKQIAGGESYLILYDRVDHLDWIAKYCDSMTTSIGDKGWSELGPWIKQCAEEAKLLVFPFENDVEPSVSKKFTRMVTPDRICAKDVQYHNGVISIEVEKFAEIFINAPKGECSPLFSMERGEIEAVESSALYAYFHLRKRVLVNGLHYYLATFAYGGLLAKRVDPKDWHAQYLPILIEYVLSDAGRGQHPIDVLIGAQAMRLVLEASRLNLTGTKSSILRPQQGAALLVATGRWNA